MLAGRGSTGDARCVQRSTRRFNDPRGTPAKGDRNPGVVQSAGGFAIKAQPEQGRQGT